MGLVKVLSVEAELGLNRPAAIAESDFESTQVNRTGITPSTNVFNSLAYLASSSVTSFIKSCIVAVSSRDLVVRTLRADLMLVDRPGSWAVSGNDNMDNRSECFVNLRFTPGLLGLLLLLREMLEIVVLERTVSWVIVV